MSSGLKPLYGFLSAGISWAEGTSSLTQNLNFTWEPQDLSYFLDCEYSSRWIAFRNEINFLGLEGGLKNERAIANSESLVKEYAGSLETLSALEDSRALSFYSVVTGELQSVPQDEYCHLGFITALWLSAISKFKANAQMQLTVAQQLLGKSFCLDFFSDSKWPLRWTDIYAPPLSRRSALNWRSAVPYDSLWLDTVIDPQGCTNWRDDRMSLSSDKRIRFAVVVDHAALSLDLAETVRATSILVEVTFICGLALTVGGGVAPQGGGFENDHAVTHVGCNGLCKISPAACARSEQVVVPPLDENIDWSARFDVAGCFRYKICFKIWSKGLPIVLVDGNFLINPYHIRGFFPGNILSEFEALNSLIVEDVHVRRRSRDSRPSNRQLPLGGFRTCDFVAIPDTPTNKSPVIIAATDPWQAENIFQSTGHRVPSVRPLALYAANCARSQSQSMEVFIPHDRGRCLACETFVRAFLQAVPKDYPVKFAYSREYRPLCSFSSFRAAVLVPHGNIVMQQFRELHTLRVKVHVPDQEMLLRQPLLWFFRRVESGFPSGWQPPFLNATPRSGDGFSAWIFGYKEGYARLSAMRWWLQFLDYLHWPGVRQFHSIADLLFAIAQPESVSDRSLADRFIEETSIHALAFWQDALARLSLG